MDKDWTHSDLMLNKWHLWQGIFEATAWICAARIRFAIVNDSNLRILNGTFGTHDVDPYWAHLTE